MSIFSYETRTVRVAAWTVDFSTFEKNPEANCTNYLPDYLVPESVVDQFDEMGYNVYVSTVRTTGVSQVIIQGAEMWNADFSYTAWDGDKVITDGERVEYVEPRSKPKIDGSGA